MLYEKLSRNEIATIEEYICRYASADHSRIDARLDMPHILRLWAREKSLYLESAFGGNLILSKPVCVTKPLSVLTDELSDIIYEECPQTYSLLKNLIDTSCPCRWDWKSLISFRTLAQNEYKGLPFEVECPNGKVIKVTAGCKPMKAISRITQEFGLDIEDIRLAHSRALNKKKLEGELCLSIHPIDYLTMSDNDCGWNSCMNWREKGGYRMGTVEMMNSHCAVVAYLKGSKDMSIEKHLSPIANKKWRQLIVVTDEVITGVKGYPYTSDELSLLAISWLKELMESTGHGPYTEKHVEIDTNCGFWIEELQREICFEFSSRCMYNDFDYNHLSYINKSLEGTTEIEFSGHPQCMKCGDDLVGMCVDNDMVLCGDCDESERCACCGITLHCEEPYEVVNGDKVCEECYREHYTKCPITGETIHEDDLVKVYIVVNKESYSRISEHPIVPILVNRKVINTKMGEEYYGPILKVQLEKYLYCYPTKHIIEIEKATERVLEEVGLSNPDNLKGYLESQKELYELEEDSVAKIYKKITNKIFK